MHTAEIKEIIQLFSDSNVHSLKLELDGLVLRLDKEGKTKTEVVTIASPATAAPQETTALQVSQAQPQSPKPSPATQPANKDADFITSPMVGTFYRSPSPGAAPYVSVGDTVKKGQTRGIVEAMKIMNEIEADFDCKILEIEVNDTQPVEFGTKLVMVQRV